MQLQILLLKMLLVSFHRMIMTPLNTQVFFNCMRTAIAHVHATRITSTPAIVHIRNTVHVHARVCVYIVTLDNSILTNYFIATNG